MDSRAAGRRPGQRVAAHREHGQARQDQVAEALAPARPVDIDADAGDRGEARQQRGELRELVGVVVAVERRESCRRPPAGRARRNPPSRGRGATMRRGIDAAVECRGAHWMFQVISFIGSRHGFACTRLADAGAHEGLHELALEQQEARPAAAPTVISVAARDDRPVDALVGRGEDLQADGQRPRLDRVGDDQRPQEVVPVVADRDQRRRRGRSALASGT